MDKFLIVGLGNPGAEYDHTRHNTGFMVVDELAKSVGATFEDKRYGFVAETSLKDRKVFILKPTTYMNLTYSSSSDSSTPVCAWASVPTSSAAHR